MKHSSTTTVKVRELSHEERVLVERLLHAAGAGADIYLSQLPVLRVVSNCSCGCPSIDFGVGERRTSITGRTTIIAEGDGVSPEGVRFGVLLHAREGFLSELEIYAIDQDPPFTLPDIDQVHIYAA